MGGAVTGAPHLFFQISGMRSDPPNLTKHMFVMGIDPGLSATGYGWWRAGILPGLSWPG